MKEERGSHAGNKDRLWMIAFTAFGILLVFVFPAMAAGIGGPTGGAFGAKFVSDNANVPMEARLGEDIDVGVQHDDTTVLILFPISRREDNKINEIRSEKYFVKTRLSETRMQVGLDGALLDDGQVRQLVATPQSLAIDCEKKTGSGSTEGDTAVIKIRLTFRTQNGFQNYVKSDFNRSGFIVALLSVVPGLGYSYADESTSSQYSFFSRAIILGASLSPATQLSSACTALSGVLYFAEAKNSVSLVQEKDRVADGLRKKGLEDESQLVISDLAAIKNKPKKLVKYPAAMFDLSLVTGARAFPFRAKDDSRLTLYTGFSVGFRDCHINSFIDQRNAQKSNVRASYYDDYYSFGWKNVYSAGYDSNNDHLTWNVGMGRTYHTEWFDLMGGLSVGEYDNPASIYLESRLNLAPLTCFDGTYVEVHSPY